VRKTRVQSPAVIEGYALEPPVNVYNVECGEFVGTPRLTVRSTEHIFTQGVTIQGLYLIAFRRIGVRIHFGVCHARI